ncbi:MAG: ATP-binding cassette domain-containing protein [Treponema sp.]|nr:ATP-binding cassette domain-containing protein [Treponema sp.]
MTLELRDICLSYSKKTVLDNLCITFRGGEIHALLGENGAGKSTTANIICGEVKPESGSILIDGEQIELNSPKTAITHGICYVHQRPMLADYISVKENILLGLKKELKKEIPVITQKWIPGVNLNAFVKNFGADTRFFIALCIALIKHPSLLILDEPTALLDEEQRVFLYNNLRTLANDGMNIIVITHNFDEAENYCDTIDFLEDGRLAEKKQLPALNVSYKSEDMSKKEVLSFHNISTIHDKRQNLIPLFDVSFDVAKGAITLIKGLAEDGLDTLEEVVTERALRQAQGPHNSSSGALSKKVESLCKKVGFLSLSKGRQNIGIIPTNRKYIGSNPNLTVEQMLTTALTIPEKEKPAAALEMIKNSGVDIQPQEKCSCLSGGMLQKLMFERELYGSPEFLILCNPLQGLDTATCTRTCGRIKEAAQKGAYVLILSYGAFPSGFCDIQYKLSNGKLEVV